MGRHDGKREAMINTTKDMYADSLMRKLEHQTLDRITVTDIAQDCGTTRQAFYYHFDDIYDLLEWIYLQESTKLLENNRDIHTWQRGQRLILDWMQSHRAFVINTYRSIKREYLENFLADWLYPLLLDVVEAQSDGLCVTADEKKFLARFYTLALVATSMDWISRGMDESAEMQALRVEVLIKDNIRTALARYDRLHKITALDDRFDSNSIS